MGRSLGVEEAFWFTVIQWFCNHPMLDPSQVQPLLDYIEHRKEDTDRRHRAALEAAAHGARDQVPGLFSMKGRTATTLFRDMERWHADLAREADLVRRERFTPYSRQAIPAVFEPSGLRGLSWEVKKGRKRSVWTIVELLTARALSDEGRGLAHCVYSYGHSVAKGRSSIWSMRLDRERVVTVEVDNANRRIVQVRGLRNRLPTNGEREVLRRWAEQSDLAIRA